jgi:hypothetical protein
MEGLIVRLMRRLPNAARYALPLGAGLLLAALLAILAPRAGAAPAVDAGGRLRYRALPEPPRYLATLGAGATLRFTRNIDFGQEQFGPVFTDGLVGYVLSGRGALGHGPALGFSANLTSDGGYTEPVHPGEQWTVMPAYLLYRDLHPDWLSLAHLGIPFVALGEAKTWGMELAAAIGYRVLSGTGVYTEATFTLFPGAVSSVHPAASLELGVFLDYEALP